MVDLNSLNPFTPTVKSTTTISSLRIYPIKSCRGISITSSYLTRRGLDLDRNWMFIDSTTNKFVTIRDISALTLIDTALATSTSPTANGSEDDLELVVSLRGAPDKRIQIPARPTKEWLQANCRLEEVNIWDYKTDGWVYGAHISSLFASYLDKPLALVYKGPTPRVLRGNGAPEELGREEATNFPDVLPLQIANEASIAELNSRLRAKQAQEISIERFRPNIIVAGGEGEGEGVGAWSEDDWRVVRVVNGPTPTASASGSVLTSLGTALHTATQPAGIEIDVMAHCARCQVPNVDPDTAEKDAHEPWDTLVSYRRIDEGIKWKPCFGMLSCPRGEGPIKVGMKLEVLETTANHLYKKGF